MEGKARPLPLIQPTPPWRPCVPVTHGRSRVFARVAQPTQRRLSEGELKLVNDKMSQPARSAEICTYCSLVYNRSERTVMRYEWLDNSMMGSGFKLAR